MKFAIIGGAGAIGSHLTDKCISEEHEVKVLDSYLTVKREEVNMNPGAEYFEVDGTKIVDDDIEDADVIVNLAEITGLQECEDNPEKILENNVGVATRLMKVISDSGLQTTLKKIILVSSHSVYGDGSYYCPKCKKYVYRSRERHQLNTSCRCGTRFNVKPTSEMKPCIPQSVYGVAGKAREDITFMIQQRFQVPVVCLRVWNVYGSRIRNGMMAHFVNRIIHNEPIEIYEDGLQWRDFIHVHDVVSAIYLASMKEDMNGEIFNVGTGNRATILGIANMLIDKFGKGSIEKTGAFRDYDVRHIVSDVRKIRRHGYKTTIGLDGGIKETKLWLRRIGMIENI